MSNMTDTNWPDPNRPGVPLFPDAEGWHLVGFLGAETPMKWLPGGSISSWMTVRGIRFSAFELSQIRHTGYIGAVLTCTQIEQQEETIKALQDDLSAALAQIEEYAGSDIYRDSERLDWLESDCCDVRFRSSPIADTGDADVYCDIVQHHMEKPRERTIGSAETIRAAIDAAREEGE